MKDLPANVVATVGIVVLGVIVCFLACYNIDKLMIESIVIIIGGLSGYKIKDSVDKKTIETLEEKIRDLQTDKT